MIYKELGIVIIRAVVSLITLFFATKLLGKKQISELSLFDYVIGISIGNFAAECTINIEIQFLNGIMAILVFSIIALLISKLTMKSIKVRRYISGFPTPLVYDGKIIYNNMSKANIDINDLLEQSRINGYFDLKDVAYAILEANGQISFMPKANSSPVKVQDMNIKVGKESMCANIIIDGKIIYNNLKNMNKDEKWLNNQIKVQGVKQKNILLATLDDNDNLNIYPKYSSKQDINILE